MIHLSCGRVLFAAFVLLCLFSIAAVYMANKVEYKRKKKELECGPMPSLMAAVPNMGGALCSTPQSLADAHYYGAVQ